MANGTNGNGTRSWQGIGINAGTLVAIAALFGTAFLAGVSVPAWLDQRIDNRVDNQLIELQYRIEDLEQRVDRLEGETPTEADTEI